MHVEIINPFMRHPAISISATQNKPKNSFENGLKMHRLKFAKALQPFVNLGLFLFQIYFSPFQYETPYNSDISILRTQNKPKNSFEDGRKVHRPNYFRPFQYGTPCNFAISISGTQNKPKNSFEDSRKMHRPKFAKASRTAFYGRFNE